MAFLEYKPFKPYFHYTSLEGFKGIITSKKLWFSSLNGSNDPREVVLGHSKIMQALKRVRHDLYPGHRGFFISILAGMLTSAMKTQKIYTTSLTSLNDSIPLWREYGSRGKGVAMGFKPRALRDIHCRIHKVHYIPSADDDNMVQLVADFIRSMENLGFEDDPKQLFATGHADIRISVITSLLSVMHSVKTGAWRYEDELRLSFASGDPVEGNWEGVAVTELPNGQPVLWQPPLIRPAPRGDVQYYEIPYGRFSSGEYDPKNAFSEIVIGPNADVAVEEIEKFLATAGMDVPRVSKSENIFR